MSIVVGAHDNPVLCALSCMRSWANGTGVLVDEDAFYLLARACDIRAQSGFVIHHYAEVARLCEIGKFVIVIDGYGRITARQT